VNRPARLRPRAPKEPGERCLQATRRRRVSTSVSRTIRRWAAAPKRSKPLSLSLIAGSRSPPGVDQRAMPQSDESLHTMSVASTAAMLRQPGQPPATWAFRKVHRKVRLWGDPSSLRVWPAPRTCFPSSGFCYVKEQSRTAEGEPSSLLKESPNATVRSRLGVVGSPPRRSH